MGPGSFVFPANPHLADILVDTDFDFEGFHVCLFFNSSFLGFQVPRFLKSGLGRASVGTGMGGLGPWAGWALGRVLGLGRADPPPKLLLQEQTNQHTVSAVPCRDAYLMAADQKILGSAFL